MSRLATALASLASLAPVASTALAAGLALAACSHAKAGAPAGPVTFTLSVDARAYADGPIQITVWNAEQLALRERAGECVVEHDATGTRTHCPPGVTLVEAHPEQLTLTRAELVHPITIRAASLRPGERYELAIGGIASDGCNSATALARGIATGTAMRLVDLDVMTTDLACVRDR